MTKVPGGRGIRCALSSNFWLLLFCDDNHMIITNPLFTFHVFTFWDDYVDVFFVTFILIDFLFKTKYSYFVCHS